MRTIIKVFALIFFFIFIHDSHVFSQEIHDYVVFRFERERKNFHDEVEVFFWITPFDSINQQRFPLYPLYLSEISNNDLIKCFKREIINPYLVTNEETIDLSDSQKKIIGNLELLTNNNKVLLQTVKKDWQKNQKETVKIFATPIKGVFHSCPMTSFGNIDYEGWVFLPVNNFSLISEFWKSDRSKKLRKLDYSFFFFVNTATGGSLDRVPRWGEKP